MVSSWHKLEAIERDRNARLVFTRDFDYKTSKPAAPGAWYE